MELVIPDGAQVHITVGQPPLLALPQDPRAVASLPERSSRRIVKGLLAGVLLIGAFQAGRFLPHHVETASAAQPPTSPAKPSVTGSSAAGEIPPAFRAQIAQPPHVVPPPGAAPAAATGGSTAPAAAPAPANPFGLQG
jgi:hypothetical protein